MSFRICYVLFLQWESFCLCLVTPYNLSDLYISHQEAMSFIKSLKCKNNQINILSPGYIIILYMQNLNSVMHFNMQVVEGSVRLTWMQKQLQWRRRKKNLMELTKKMKKQDKGSSLSIGEDTLKMCSCTCYCVTIFVNYLWMLFFIFNNNIKEVKNTP